ncbi:squamosa promoter-binding-like protein 7 isoform X1 [Salvia hispanica]|uniref:squamosa promoter-binding-like protein 7 isoform X1 n=1 Tax=Salvia hispanica TaxID=49212 RepID=UPI002008F9EB|nr:squamosa promoter-binding-like protein 7 isoform X1 [Salvia hispanica]
MEQNQIPTPPIEAQIPADDPTASSLFDWSDFLDFNVDEGLHPAPSLPHSEQEQEQEQAGGSDPAQEKPGAVRKRDPRLLCSNFLARVPCACPELDAKLAEEERQLPSKKRTRVARGPSGPARCQVPGCEDDISELKGYHKRHRVCLRCANAVSVVIDGEAKRYCQQCGKFHILSDFDEGKRSCRRKLERHNNRRRRKPHDSKEGTEKESQPIILADDLSGDDDDAGKDGISVNGQIEEKEPLLESDGQVSVRGSQNLQSDSIVSLSTSGEPHAKADTQDPTFKQSPPYCDNKSSYSSACPAGRISFKLYDWNPAEFPRRLRLQIFQWLASMPVELEGYIRPGCTILTAFIAMPEPVWRKLLEEPALCIKNLVSSPGSLLSGRGAMHVYLNDMIFRITKDATLVHEVKVKHRAPKLHFIYPNCFEAGRPMEFVACGSHLLQPNFRFLISFAGQYLAYKIRVSSPCEKGHANSADHQLLKIYVPQIDIALSGPGFVEVENQSGLSNFIPVLVSDKETCAEMVILQQKSATPFSSSSSSQELECCSPRPACEVLASRQAEFSEFVLDVAWLLKKPASKQKLTSSHILRLNCLLKYLMEKESTVVLDGLCCSMRSAMDNDLVDSDSDSDLRLLQKNMNTARRRLAPRSHQKVVANTPTPSGNCCSHSSENDASSLIPSSSLNFISQGLQRTVKKLIGLVRPRPSLNEDTATVPLLQDEVIMNVNLQERPSRSWSSRTLSTWRLLVMAVMAVGVCFGVCAVVVHPQQVGRITSTIHSCVFDNSGR